MVTTRDKLFKQAIIIIINESHISKTNNLSFIMIRRSVYMTGLQTFEKDIHPSIFWWIENGSLKINRRKNIDLCPKRASYVFLSRFRGGI